MGENTLHDKNANTYAGTGQWEVRNHHKNKDKRHHHQGNPCNSPPLEPSLTFTFQATEARTHLRFTGKIKWPKVTDDQDGFPVKVELYEIVYVAVNAAGNVVETEDGKMRVRVRRKQPLQSVKLSAATAAASIATFTTRKEHGFASGDKVTVSGVTPAGYNGTWTVIAVTDTTFTANIGSTPANGTNFDKNSVVEDADDSLHIITGEAHRPKTWYWKARGRTKSTDGCWSGWSPWTTPVLPWTGADPQPPTPTGLALNFYRDRRNRHRRIYAVVSWNEVLGWDVPGGDHEDDMKAYAVQLQRSDDGTTKTGHTRVRHKSAKGDETDPDDEVLATFRSINKRNWYRARVRSIDRFNRRGPWTTWTSWLTPGASGLTIPAPTSLTLDVDEHAFHGSWVLPKLSGGNVPDNDIDHVEVEVRTATAGGGTLLHSDYFVRGERRSFKASKPGTSTYFLRVRSVTEDEETSTTGVSGWVETSATKTTPSQPGVPTMAFTDTGKAGNRYRAEVTVATVADTDHEIDRYTVQFVHKSTNSTPTSGDKRDSKNVDARGTSNELTATWRGIPEAHYCFARTRAVDTDGQKSNWSNWSAAVQPSGATGPSNAGVSGTVSSVATSRYLISNWGQATDDKFHHYRVEIRRTADSALMENFTTMKNRYRYRVPVANRPRGSVGSESSLPYQLPAAFRCDVYVVDEFGNESAVSSGAVVQSSTVLEANEQLLDAGVGAYLDGSLSVSGSIFLNDDGAKIATGNTGAYIELKRVASSGDAIRFVTGTGTTIIRASNGGVQIGQGIGEQVGFYGHAPVARHAALTGSRGSATANVINQIADVLDSLGLVVNNTTA